MAIYKLSDADELSADELSGTEDMHDMDLDASAMDQERAHCVTLVSSIV